MMAPQAVGPGAGAAVRIRPRVLAGSPAIMAAHGLVREFTVRTGMFEPRRTLHAVNGVDLAVQRGDVLGIVGESGCGKSTLARMLLGLLAPTGGSITLDGEDIRKIGRRAMSRRVQPVFQDPYSSLNPRRTVAGIVGFPLVVHRVGTPAERRRRVAEMLDHVGLSGRHADSLPGQLSGGQRQRVAIARALIMKPDIVICDEPTSALDVSVQAQILNLLQDLRRQFNLTYIFISHNLAVVEHIATHVAVMYLGSVVEYNRADALFGTPRHPYTQALLASVLSPEPGKQIPDAGLGLAFPDPLNPPGGCTFHPRCPKRLSQCDKVIPKPVWKDGAMVACHLYPQESDL